MKNRSNFSFALYLLFYALYALLALWLLPVLLEQATRTAQTAYQFEPLVAANVLYWSALAFLLFFRTHQITRLGQKGVFLSAALLLLSLCLTVFAFLQNRGWSAMLLLTVEELYDTVLLLKAKRHAARLEADREKPEIL